MRPGFTLNLVALGAVLLTALPTSAVAAKADGSADMIGWTDGQGVGARVSVESKSATRGASRRSGKTPSGPQCTYSPLPQNLLELAESAAAVGYVDPKGNFEGAWYRKECIEDGLSTLTVDWRKAPTPRQPVDLAGVALRALNYVPIPEPAIGMNPAAERVQLVNVPIVLWIDPGGWTPVGTSASAGASTVSVQAVPLRITWDMGNGDSVVCGPGLPYSGQSSIDAPGTCSYTYRQPSGSQPGGVFTVTATAEWRASWTSTSGAGGDLGTVRRVASRILRVSELQAINTVPAD